MTDTVLQAHRGVAAQAPENTMSAFKFSYFQGYKNIELDPAVTKDGEIVILHDKSINRTARTKDGLKIEKETAICDITYKKLLEYDFGVWFSNKFKGEKIPLFSEVLEFFKDKDVILKIDNKFQKFSPKDTENLFSLCKNYQNILAFTVNDVKNARLVKENLPDAEIHYDGIISKETAEELITFVPSKKLVMWMPLESFSVSWIKDENDYREKCELIKTYARLGIWIVSSTDEFEKSVKKYLPDIIETNGVLKPLKRQGFIPDIHTHSCHSHDSKCEIADMAKSALKKNVSLITVTDHLDVEFWGEDDIETPIKESNSDAERTNLLFDKVEILKGVEIGEAIWHKDAEEKILCENEFDLVIGSVHAVRFDGYEMPYSLIDFSKMEKNTLIKYLDKYFDEVLFMLKTTDIDVMAHLTCPFRYVNGKYSLGIDADIFREKIEEILRYIISHGIAMEINTSCKGSNYDEFMPEERYIKLYRDLGGDFITLGSDAHVSENCGHAFSEVVSLLKKYGFSDVYYFENRIPRQCKIAGE